MTNSASAAAAPALDTAYESYNHHVKEAMAAAGWPWPEHVLLDRQKQPRFVFSTEELVREMQVGSHMNEVLVFVGGLDALGQRSAVEPRIAAATGLDKASEMPGTAYEVLARLSESQALDELKGKVTYRRDAESHADSAAGGRCNACLAPKWEALQHE